MTTFFLRQTEYESIARLYKVKKHWYGYPRGFALGEIPIDDIYINDDAFYIDKRDRQLLLDHETGHTEGKDHTLSGVMSPWGLIRYLTTFK